MIKILHKRQHGRTLCLGLGKINLFTPLCIDLDLGSFMKVVDMGIKFLLALV